jgi:hypothetical protein
MLTETQTIVEAVKSLVVGGGIPAKGQPPRSVIYDNRTFFVIRPTAFKCAGCKMALVPQYGGGMTKWTKKKLNWIKMHVACTGGVD